MVTRIANWSWRELEGSLLPTKGNFIQRTAVYAYQFFKFLVMLPVAASFSLLATITRLCSRRPVDSPFVAFAKKPQWGPPLDAAPVPIGFASADYQDNGPAVHPLTNWGRHDIVNNKDGNFGHMPDIWHHPERVIERLNETGVKIYRCSVSRDKLQPQKDGPFDPAAVQHLRDHIRLFRANGIDLRVTLSHFAEPLYFSWDRAGDVAGFVDFAERVSEILYEEGVRTIVTINEPTVVAFQGWVMGMFPPYKKLDFETSAKVIENMMRAHDQIYTRLKARHADFQVGFSHDPIEFSPYHKKHPLWAPVEKGVCHVLTEVNGGAFDRMMETGEFELRVPFLCNYSFKLPRKPPMDFFGLQFYTRPLVQISLCGAGSVSRVPGEKITSYEYRQYPQGIVSALGKYGKLKTPTGQPVKIKITEVGIDRGINRDETDAQRIAYFDRINQAVKFAKDHGVEVDEIDYWTLIDNSEWYKRWGVRFGFYKFDPATGAIERLPLARWVADRVAARNRALPQPAAAPAA